MARAVCKDCGRVRYCRWNRVTRLAALRCGCGGKLRAWRHDHTPAGRPLVCSGCESPIARGEKRAWIGPEQAVCLACHAAAANARLFPIVRGFPEATQGGKRPAGVHGAP